MPGRRVQNHRGLPFDLAEESAKLPVADHAQRACRRAGTRREEIQLQPRRARLETDGAGRIQMAQVVARYPVPAEDQVVADVHIHRRDRHRLAELITEAKVDKYRAGKSQCATRSRRRDRSGAGLARQREAECRGQAGADEAVSRAGVEQDCDLPWPLNGRKDA